MAWWNGGDWNNGGAGLPIDPAIKNIMAQVCTAINERQAAQGRTETAWAIYGGTKARPVAADFVGMTVNEAAQNMATIRTQIGTFAAAYTSSGGIKSKWTNAARDTYISTSAIATVAARIGHYAFWNECKTMLESLRYLIYYWGGPDEYGANESMADLSRNNAYYNEPSGTSWYTAWNHAIAAGIGFYSSAYTAWYFGGDPAAVWIRPQTNYDFADYDIITGTKTAQYISVAGRDAFAAYPNHNTFTDPTPPYTRHPMILSSDLWDPLDNPEIMGALEGLVFTFAVNISLDLSPFEMTCNIPASCPLFYSYIPDHPYAHRRGYPLFGAPSLTSPNTTCVFTELEVGTHLTYG